MGNCCTGSYSDDDRNSIAHLSHNRVDGNVMKPSTASMQDPHPGLKRPISPAVARAGLSADGASDRMKARSCPAAPVHGLTASNVGEAPVASIVTPNLKVFTLAELRTATRNFGPDTLLGEGGFGRVFKGWIDPNTLAPSKVGVGIPVAIKKCSPDSGQGRKEWETEVNFLGKLSHPNLVKLIGYGTEEKELLLVYEYMHKGSLEGHLFNKKVEPPSWSLRMKVATDAARGLDFLHTSKKTVIYRDFKTSNILLDEDYNAKLSDFGLARLGPANGNTHVSTQAVGTYGYAAPEYISTGHLYVNSDVYGFGVVLLEILTGLKAYDLQRPASRIDLVELHKRFLRDRGKLKKIIDPRLMDRYPPEGAQKLAQLILRCLETDPRHRPSMSQVLVILEQINTIVMKPKKTRSEPPQRNLQDHDPIDRYISSNISRPGQTGPLRSPSVMP